MPPQRLTVVLVGQTGNGKSATGNSLLGRDAFAAKRSFASVTERCARRVSWLDEDDALVASASGDDDAAGSVSEDVSRRTELCVIDTPGTCDSGALLEDNLAHISAHLRGEDEGAAEMAKTRVNEKDAMTTKTTDASDPARVHAFVLVLSAAARFTQEEAIALERLVGRLGKDALRHACVAVTRAEELATDAASAAGDAAKTAKTFAADLARSAPAGLRRLMERMPYHARGAPPVLVENFPSDAYAPANENETTTETTGKKKTRRFRAAAAPLLAAARDICHAVAVERGVAISERGPARTDLDLAACAYEPEQLARANTAATADPSTAALAMLDRLKRQLAEGAFGGGGGGEQDGMAAAARRAFEDLSAQFAARAAGGDARAFAPAAATDRGAPRDTRFGGLFGGSSDAAADAKNRAARPEAAFAGAAALAEVFDADAFPATTAGTEGSGDVIVRVSGFGNALSEARGAFTLGQTGGRLLFKEKASSLLGERSGSESRGEDAATTPATGRARVAGRVSCVGGGFVFAITGERHAVTMHSPAFLSTVGGPSKTFRPTRPISDDDWVEENAHFVALHAARARSPADTASTDGGSSFSDDADADSVRVVVRGGSAGVTPDVALVLDADARFELTGGSLSVWNAAVEARFDDPPRAKGERSSSSERVAKTRASPSSQNRHHSLAFDGALDVAPSIGFEFGASSAETRRAAFKARQTWPWRAAEDASRD